MTDANLSVRARAVRRFVARTGSRGLETASRVIRRALAQPTAGDVVATLVTLGACLAVGSSLIGSRLAAVGVGAGVASALVAVLLASPHPVIRGLGGALAVPTAVAMAVPITTAWAFAIGIAGFGPFAALTVWALVFAALAATLVSWDRLGDGGARRASTGAMLALLGVAGVVVIRIVPEAGVRERATAILSSTVSRGLGIVVHSADSFAVISFFGLCFLAAVAVTAVIGYVPFERFVPPDRREATSSAVDRIKRGCSITIRLSLVGVFAALTAPVALGRFDAVPLSVTELAAALPTSIGNGLTTVLTASPLRYVLLALVVAALMFGFAEWFRRAIRRGLATILVRAFAPAIGGATVATALAFLVANPAVDATLQSILAQFQSDSFARLLLEFPTFALVAAVLVLALGMLSSLFLTVSMLRIVRVLPPRAIGAALAATAVFGLAISLSIIGRIEPAIWTASAAFVVWDVGEHADEVRAELGREAKTMRVELVHAGGSVLTGVVVALGAIGLYRWVVIDAPLADARLAAAAVGAGLVAVALVAWILRAR